MKLYIAGKMTGDPGYREKFSRAAEKLEAAGHIVLNQAKHPDGLTQGDYMLVDIAMIHCADAAVFLPDWTESEGAKVERAYCHKIGKPVKDWDTFAEVERVCKTCGGLCEGERCYAPLGASLGQTMNSQDRFIRVDETDYCSAWYPKEKISEWGAAWNKLVENSGEDVR